MVSDPININPNTPQQSKIYEGGVTCSKIVCSIGRIGNIIRRKNRYNSNSMLNPNFIKPTFLSDRIIPFLKLRKKYLQIIIIYNF